MDVQFQSKRLSLFLLIFVSCHSIEGQRLTFSQWLKVETSSLSRNMTTTLKIIITHLKLYFFQVILHTCTHYDKKLTSAAKLQKSEQIYLPEIMRYAHQVTKFLVHYLLTGPEFKISMFLQSCPTYSCENLFLFRYYILNMIILGNLFIRPEDVFCGKTSTFNLISTMSLVIQGRFDLVHKKSLCKVLRATLKLQVGKNLQNILDICFFYYLFTCKISFMLQFWLLSAIQFL